MDDQTNNPGNQDTRQAEDSDQMLPPVQVPDDSANQSEDESDQPIPASRALVTTPEEASDSDLIEKEWVLKAKQIVEHTSEDPFAQAEELTKMKADYMRKRYNKEPGHSN